MTTATDEEPFLVFRADVRLGGDDGTVTLTSPVGGYRLSNVPAAVADALRRLRVPVSLPELLEPLNSYEREQLRRVLDRGGQLLARCLVHDGRELVRIEPVVRDASYRPAPVTGSSTLKLSTFAFCRSRDEVLALESPLAEHRVHLLDVVAQRMVAALAGPRTVDELCDGEVPAGTVVRLLAHLAGLGFVDVGRPGADGVVFDSQTDPALRQWDFHDLLFHSRSQRGRYDDPCGAVFPYLGQIDPQPAVKPLPAGPVLPLPRPSLADIAARDLSLTEVLENRTSIRTYGDTPITLAQLGEFLYRVGRVRGRSDATADVPYERTSRPYPSGGAAYELELYLTVHRCDGLDQGIYYYGPDEHQLVLINSDQDELWAMSRTAPLATGVDVTPDVLITITSRFQRLSWKYRSIAYAVTLRNVGVLYQTMYLVATAMGLAPCGLGSGQADLAARALRLDYLRESSVGDFALGSTTGSGL